jgi:hypothetical protein
VLIDHGNGFGDSYPHNQNQEETQSKTMTKEQTNMEEKGNTTSDTFKENIYINPRRRSCCKYLRITLPTR